MPETNRDIDIDWNIFRENQEKYPPDLLAEFEGKHVAWSLDGKAILASGDDMSEVYNNLLRDGIDPQRIVYDYVDPPDLARF